MRTANARYATNWSTLAGNAKAASGTKWALQVADGFKIYVEEQQLSLPLSEFQSQELHYRDEGFQIIGYYEIVDNSPEKVTAEIERLKTELTSTDYQIIKSYEYTLAAQPLPYDLDSLHSERQQLRERIRELEQIILNP